MAEAQQQLVDIDPDFEPLSRPRSCTWPLHRPEFSEPGSSNTSSPAPSVKPEQGIVDFINSLSLLEETEDYQEEKRLLNDFHCQDNCVHPQQQHPQQSNPQLTHPQQVPPLPTPASSTSPAAAQRKSSSSRRNAWGNMSYADLITKAIESSPEKRLTLSQIYEWMVKSVPYFKDKGDSNSSAGWKVMALQGQAEVWLKVALEAHMCISTEQFTRFKHTHIYKSIYAHWKHPFDVKCSWKYFIFFYYYKINSKPFKALWKNKVCFNVLFIISSVGLNLTKSRNTFFFFI